MHTALACDHAKLAQVVIDLRILYDLLPHWRIIMSQTKRAIEEREQGQDDAANRDGRRCPSCDGVVPYGTDFGPNGECPACVGALRDD